MGACCSSNEHCPVSDREAPRKKQEGVIANTNVTVNTNNPPIITIIPATPPPQPVSTPGATTALLASDQNAPSPTPTTTTTITTATTTVPTPATPLSTTSSSVSLRSSPISTTSPATAATTTTGKVMGAVRRLSRKLSISTSRKAKSARVKPNAGVDAGDDSSDLDADDHEEVRRRDQPLIVLFHRPDNRQSTYDVQELKVLGTLGSGEFGKVELVEDPRDRETYALKTIDKAHMRKMGKEETVKNEWMLQAQLDHVFINKLYCALEDDSNIYLLLQPSMGGELWSLIRQRQTLDMAATQFYIASVVLAFEYMHEKQIIYRDLKPENILLDAQGYIQLCDFGCAKKMTHMLLRTYSEVGTPAYSCPEMINGEGHNNAMDWWDLGVLMFEMLTGTTPFVDAKGDDAMAERIRKVDYAFPPNFPKTEQGNQAKDLIKKLLQKNPEKRLGVNKEALDQLKSHPVFKGLDWEELSRKRLLPPFVPELRDRFDLKYFSK